MAPDVMADIDLRLERWGPWVKDFDAGLGYPASTLTHKVSRRKLTRRGTVSLSWQRSSLRQKLLTGRGAETRSYLTPEVGEPPEGVMEIDRAIARLLHELREILRVEFIYAYGAALEVKSRMTGLPATFYRRRLQRAKDALRRELQ